MSGDSKTLQRNQQQVTCPHCQATQTEPIGAISTNCRRCGRYFKLDEKRVQKATRAPVASREIFCMKCQTSNRVTSAALSTQCVRCSTYLDLRDIVVRGGSTERIHTYGILTFAAGSTYRGFSAEARRIKIQGKVFTKLSATNDVILSNGATLSGELRAAVVEAQRGSQIKVQMIVADRMMIEGDVQVNGEVKVRDLTIRPGGSLTAPQIVTQHVQVEAGGFLQGRLKTEQMEVREVLDDDAEGQGDELETESAA